MRTWNYSRLGSLEEQVLVSGTGHQINPSDGRRASAKRTQFTAQIGVALAIAALAVVSVSLPISSNSPEVSLSASSGSIASNVRSRPPIELLFGGRFDAEWTEDLEKRLLDSAAQKAFLSPDEDRQNLIHTAQQESLSNDVPRLTSEAVIQLTRRRG